jgi:uncharacterized protein (DUF2336 family)
MTSISLSSVPELDTMLMRVSGAQRAAILQQVVDLFLAGAGAFSAHQVAMFDAIMKTLTVNVEPTALIQLGVRLAETDAAPIEIIIRLSNDDDIAVARPVLERSNVLTDEHLVETARTKSQNHLLAIAGRVRITAVVTDVLVHRGNLAVMQRVTANLGATLSERGFCRLISEAGDDQRLGEMVAERQDLPPELLPFLKQSIARAVAAAKERQAAQAAQQAGQQPNQQAAKRARG